jgi:hypothetical protein
MSFPLRINSHNNLRTWRWGRTYSNFKQFQVALLQANKAFREELVTSVAYCKQLNRKGAIITNSQLYSSAICLYSYR